MLCAWWAITQVLQSVDDFLGLSNVDYSSCVSMINALNRLPFGAAVDANNLSASKFIRVAAESQSDPERAAVLLASFLCIDIDFDSGNYRVYPGMSFKRLLELPQLENRVAISTSLSAALSQISARCALTGANMLRVWATDAQVKAGYGDPMEGRNKWPMVTTMARCYREAGEFTMATQTVAEVVGDIERFAGGKSHLDCGPGYRVTLTATWLDCVTQYDVETLYRVWRRGITFMRDVPFLHPSSPRVTVDWFRGVSSIFQVYVRRGMEIIGHWSCMLSESGSNGRLQILAELEELRSRALVEDIRGVTPLFALHQ